MVVEQLSMSQNMMNETLRSLYEEGGVTALRAFQKELKTYMSKVSDLESQGDEMMADLIPDQKKLDQIAKSVKKHTKALHKSLKAHFVNKRKVEREEAKEKKEALARAKALEPKRPRGRPADPVKAAAKLAAKKAKQEEKEAAAKKRQMAVPFGYFKRILRDAKRVSSADAKLLARIAKTAKVSHKKAMKELKANAIAKRKAEREAKGAEPKKKVYAFFPAIRCDANPRVEARDAKKINIAALSAISAKRAMIKELKAKHVADRKKAREAKNAAKAAEPKRKPGRPRKQKVVESSNGQNDLITDLLETVDRTAIC